MIIYYLIIVIILVSGLTFYFIYIKPRQDPLNKALGFARQNKFLEAITEYKRVLYTKPDAFNIHFQISDLYIRQENFEQAIYHLNEILRIDRFNLEVQKEIVIKRLAKAYYLTEDIEKAFQKYLELLKLNPDDVEACYQVAFISLGQEEFEIAQRFFERLVKLEDSFESFFGAGICSYQNNKNEDAVNYFREALSIRSNSDIAILAISFALQRAGKYNEAITYVSKLTNKVTEDNVTYIARRFLSFLNIFAGKNKEGLQMMKDLLELVKEKNMQEELKLSLYDTGFACVKNNELDDAYKYWEQLYQLDNDYEQIKNILKLVKDSLEIGADRDVFESSVYDLIEDWETNSFSPDFLWDICGLKSDKLIDVTNVIMSAKTSKEKDSGKQEGLGTDTDYADRIEKFQNLDNETFRMISNRIVIKLGYKVDEILLTYRESDGVDIMATAQENNDKVLIWVRRWKGTRVGEITLRNFAQAINDHKARKGIFITTADLTQAAQESLKRLNKIKVVYPDEVNALTRGLI